MNSCDISLYAIIDPERVAGRNSTGELARLAREAALGGATIMQYRDKHGSTRQMTANAAAILDALKGTNCPLLINDRLDVALAVGAQGVHVGQDDMEPKICRRLLGPKALIGQSVKLHEQAEHAPVDVLDYICIGGVFDTQSKDNKTSVGVAGWKSLAQTFRHHTPDMPVGAIAGIDATNAADLIRAGADGVAIISAIFMADDVKAAASNLRRTITEARS